MGLFPPTWSLRPCDKCNEICQSSQLVSGSQALCASVYSPLWGEKGGGGVLLKRLVTLELGLKAHPVSKEMGREEAFAKRAPGSLLDRRFACS